MNKSHQYEITTKWTGNNGTGTSGYRQYDRDHVVSSTDKVPVACSSDPKFRGDKSKYNPEELLVASLSSCHMLWYLHLCAEAGVIVVDYADNASGTMQETADGGGGFTEVTLHPKVTLLSPEMQSLAEELHERAHKLCFIANSVNFPVHCKASYFIEEEATGA